jgi:hypothetical protein
LALVVEFAGRGQRSEVLGSWLYDMVVAQPFPNEPRR